MKLFRKKFLPKPQHLSDVQFITMAFNSQSHSLSQLTKQSDEILFDAYLTGDMTAFDVLLQRYQKPLFAFLYRSMGNSESANDAFQEIFLKVVKSAHEFRRGSKFSTWIYTIARHYCIDESRRGLFRNHISLDQSHDEQNEATTLMNVLADQKSNHEETLSVNEMSQWLNKALQEISPEQREVFLMREIQNLSFEDISRLTGASLNTTKSRMRYALQSLQQWFAEKNIFGHDDSDTMIGHKSSKLKERV